MFHLFLRKGFTFKFYVSNRYFFLNLSFFIAPPPARKKPKEHLAKYWNQTIWFSFLPVLLPWKEYIWSDLMSQRCVSLPNHWLLSRQVSCNLVCKYSPHLEGNFMVKNQIVLILSGKTGFSPSPFQFLPPSSTTNTHIHTTPRTYHFFPRVLPRELDYLAQWRANRSSTKVMKYA